MAQLMAMTISRRQTRLPMMAAVMTLFFMQPTVPGVPPPLPFSSEQSWSQDHGERMQRPSLQRKAPFSGRHS